MIALLVYPLSIKLLPQFIIYDSKRLVQCCLLASLSTSLLLCPQHLRLTLNTWRNLDPSTRYAWGGIALIGFLSSILASQPSYATLEWCLYALLFIHVLYIATLYQQLGEKRRQYFMLLLLGTFLIYLCLYMHQTINQAIQEPCQIATILNKNPGFNNPRFFAYYQLWLLAPLMFFGINSSQNRWKKCLWLMMCFIWCTNVLNHGSKGLWLAIVSGSACTYLMCSGNRKQILNLLLPFLYLLMIILLLSFVLQSLCITETTGKAETTTLYSLIFDNTASKALDLPDMKSSFYSRVTLWHEAWNVWLEHPLLGVGPMHLAAENNYALRAHPHNVWLMWLAEWGTICWGLLMLILMKTAKFWRKISNLNSLALCLIWTLLTQASYASLSGNGINPLSQTMALLIIGWTLGHSQQQLISSHNIMQSNLWCWRSLIISVTTLFIYIVWPMLDSLTRNTYIWHVNNPGMPLAPRFWVQGLL